LNCYPSIQHLLRKFVQNYKLQQSSNSSVGRKNKDKNEIKGLTSLIRRVSIKSDFAP
jgi:hypothetical protein